MLVGYFISLLMHDPGPSRRLWAFESLQLRIPQVSPPLASTYLVAYLSLMRSRRLVQSPRFLQIQHINLIPCNVFLTNFAYM